MERGPVPYLLGLGWLTQGTGVENIRSPAGDSGSEIAVDISQNHDESVKSKKIRQLVHEPTMVSTSIVWVATLAGMPSNENTVTVAPIHTPASGTVLHSNVLARRDVTGAIMDAHDGSYRMFNGLWHYHAMGYGKCIENGKDAGGQCGSRTNNTINLWTSPDLRTWTFVADVLPVNSR